MKTNKLIQAAIPGTNLFAASTYLDKYGREDRYDFFKHLPNVRVPLLLMLGGLEGGFNFEALKRRGPAFHQEMPHVSYELIDGADHSYNARVPEVAAMVHNWLTSITAASSVA